MHFHNILRHTNGRSRAMMEVKKILRHMNGRSRDMMKCNNQDRSGVVMLSA